jgi:4-amino-4-deoxy-L-arabinose transferase-like glycosyltransferase
MVLGSIDGVTLIRAAQTLMIVLTIPLGYDIARRLFHPRAGLVFALILAVWFPLVELPVHLFSEPTFFFFLVLHLFLLLRWRDERRWTLLFAAGLALGLSALARSPTIYGAAFVVLWLALEQTRREGTPPEQRLTLRPASWRNLLRPHVVRPVLVFALACGVAVIPWTVRNYMVYERFILIDTIGPVNLWLHLEKYEANGVEMIKQIPQEQRQEQAMADVRAMIQRDPVAFWHLLWRNSEMHFRHIWKMQFAEDFVIKRSFFGRPLRETLVLGIVGDVLWLCFTLAGVAALAAPLRRGEGAFRWVALGWISYTIVAMMIMHIEPRYLLPIWLMLALYGSWALGDPGSFLARLWSQRLNALLALALVLALLWLIFTYRSYPQIIADGYARETHLAAGLRAYAANDYAAAEREFAATVQVQNRSIEARSYLALARLNQGDYTGAHEALSNIDAQRMSLVRGAIARAQGEHELEEVYLEDAERQAGENMQRLALQMFRPPPTSYLQMGSGHDLGYIAGFSPGEEQQQSDGQRNSYRWLQGQGRIVLPLQEPLQVGSVVALRLTAGRPEGVPLTIGFDGARSETVQIGSGKWRIYRLLVPEALAGQQRLALTLDAPVFIPAHIFPDSIDVRPLSVMVSAVRVE